MKRWQAVATRSRRADDLSVFARARYTSRILEIANVLRAKAASWRTTSLALI
jgi:hypothetical protein